MINLFFIDIVTPNIVLSMCERENTAQTVYLAWGYSGKKNENKKSTNLEQLLYFQRAFVVLGYETFFSVFALEWLLIYIYINGQ